MIRLRKLTLSAFKSFKDSHTVLFPDKGLVLIQGLNKDTGGSSGAGKSSIIEALSYVLGFANCSATDLKSKNTDEPLQVSLEIETDKGSIEITKGSNNSLKYLGSGQKITGSKNIEEHLISLLGINSVLMEALTYRPQRSFGRFLSMSDADKKDFLSNCLKELEDLEKESEKAKTNAKIIEIDLQSTKQLCQSKQTEIQNLNNLSEELAIDPSVFKQEIDKKATMVSDLIKEKDRLLFLQNEERQKYQQSIVAYKESVDLLNSERNKIFAKIHALGNLSQEMTSLQAQKNELIKSLCPTCKQQWSNAKVALEKIEADLVILTRKQMVLVVFQKERDEVSQKISLMAPPSAIAFSEQAALDSLIQNINQINMNIAKLQADFTNNLSKLNSQEAKKQLVVKLQKDLQILSAKGIELEQNFAVEDTIAKALGKQGYLGNIFDEILTEIGYEVNDLLSQIPNVDGTTLKFKTEAEGKTTGKIKKTILPVLYKHGTEMSLKVFSGGQQASIELAVDLAVGNVIGRRTGRTPGWLILDEALDNLDLVSKEACIDLLEKYAQTRLVLVIDHASEIKEKFVKVIEVSINNGISEVVI